MRIGDRVLHRDQNVGIVEAIEPWDDRRNFVDVRWQTPHDVPSCVTSTCSSNDLLVVPCGVKPPARSEEWMAESRAFCEGIRRAIEEAE